MFSLGFHLCWSFQSSAYGFARTFSAQVGRLWYLFPNYFQVEEWSQHKTLSAVIQRNKREVHGWILSRTLFTYDIHMLIFYWTENTNKIHKAWSWVEYKCKRKSFQMWHINIYIFSLMKTKLIQKWYVKKPVKQHFENL